MSNVHRILKLDAFLKEGWFAQQSKFRRFGLQIPKKIRPFDVRPVVDPGEQVNHHVFKQGHIVLGELRHIYIQQSLQTDQFFALIALSL